MASAMHDTTKDTHWHEPRSGENAGTENRGAKRESVEGRSANHENAEGRSTEGKGDGERQCER